MLNRSTNQQAISLSTDPQKIMAADPSRVVQTLQNQEAAAYIYYRYGGDGTARSYIRMVPGTTEVQDQHAPLEELWAYSNVDGALLTIKTTAETFE